MIRIGFLQHRKHPAHQPKIYQYQAVAKMEGAELFVFHPNFIRIRQNDTLAWHYEDGEWIQSTVSAPDVMIHGSPQVKLMECEGFDSVTHWSKRIPITCHAVGSKESVLHQLSQCAWTKPYIPEQFKVESYEQFSAFIEKHHEVMIKPQRGNNGNGIRKIQSQADFWVLTDGKIRTEIPFQAKQDWFVYEFEQPHAESLMQQYIHSKTPDDEAFDLRVYVQKNGAMRWTISAIHPKIAMPGSVVTNDLQGGSVALIDPFMERVYGEQAIAILRKIKQLVIQMASLLDEWRLLQGEFPLSQLGFDLGLDAKGHPWIYEVNWYPGYPAMLNWHIDVPKLHIQYAMAIAAEHRKGKWPPKIQRKWTLF